MEDEINRFYLHSLNIIQNYAKKISSNKNRERIARNTETLPSILSQFKHFILFVIEKISIVRFLLVL